MAKKKKDDDETKAETSDGSIATNDAWTGLLAVSFLALAIGSGFLAFDYMKYSEGDPPKIPPISSQLPKPVVPPPVKPDGGDKKADGGVDKKVDEKAKDKKDASLRQPSSHLALATQPEAVFVSIRQAPRRQDAMFEKKNA